jgi:hypothetical protein
MIWSLFPQLPPTIRVSRELVLRPIIALPRSSSFLKILTRTHSTHARLLDTVGILRPQWWHLSYCVGAALHSSPVKNNLLRLAESIQETEKMKKISPFTAKDHNEDSKRMFISPLEGPCKLMQCLFFQPHPVDEKQVHGGSLFHSSNHGNSYGHGKLVPKEAIGRRV